MYSDISLDTMIEHVGGVQNSRPQGLYAVRLVAIEKLILHLCYEAGPNGYFKSPTHKRDKREEVSGSDSSDSTDSSEASKKVRATAPATQNIHHPRFC